MNERNTQLSTDFIRIEIEKEATALGRRYIRLMCEDIITQAFWSGQNSKNCDTNHLQSYITRWQQEKNEVREPSVEELIEHEFNSVLLDHRYVEATMKSMTHSVKKKQNKMWLLIDDVREMDVEAIARTPSAGKKLLAAGGWDCLCLDHDLGCEETGHDILKWAFEHQNVPSKVILVTANPVGREAMQKVLEEKGYKTKNGTEFSI